MKVLILNAQVEIIPCSDKGKEFTDADDVFVEDPEQLRGKNVSFVVNIVSARGLPNKFTVSAGVGIHTVLGKLLLHWSVY